MSDQDDRTNGDDQMLTAEDMVTYQEAARLLGVSRNTLHTELRVRGVRRFRRGMERAFLLRRRDVEQIKRDRESVKPVDGGEG